MSDVLINDMLLQQGAPPELVQAQLAKYYRGRAGMAPHCLCNDKKLKLYVAKRGDLYVLKRWPGSGDQHEFTCPRYEIPLDASGLGRLNGAAITEDTETGNVKVKLGFPLLKASRTIRQTPDIEEEGQESDARDTPVHGSSSRITLRGLLHYIWEQTELNKWTPFMKGKRHWSVIHRLVKEFTASILYKDIRLGSVMMVPEQFDVDLKDKRIRERRALLSSVATGSAKRQLLMFLFEVKDIEPSTHGYKFVVKNAPDTPYYLSADLLKMTHKRFAFELEYFEHRDREKLHLIAIGTNSVSLAGNAIVEDVVLMIVNENWIPFSSIREQMAIEHATTTHRRFLKPLKYHMGPGRNLATLILADTIPSPTALYLTHPDDTEAVIKAREELIEASRNAAVFWNLHEDNDPGPIIDATRNAHQHRFAESLKEGEEAHHSVRTHLDLAPAGENAGEAEGLESRP